MASTATTSLQRLDARTILRVAACAAITTVGAQWATRLPMTPVPATWQVAAVLFAGLWLGSRAAFVSQAGYLLMGLVGAPIFAFGMGGAAYLFNPNGTGGYLLSYPFAAWLVGAVHERNHADVKSPLLACAAGLAFIYTIGCLWLGITLHLSPAQALLNGAGWFLVWDAAKAMLVVLIVSRLAGGSRR